MMMMIHAVRQNVLLLIGQVFATFFTASDSFLNAENLCSTMFSVVFRNFRLQLFPFLPATFQVL